MQVICCVCQKTKNNKSWAKQAGRPDKQLSHGYCPQCYTQMMARVEKFFVMKDCHKNS